MKKLSTLAEGKGWIAIHGFVFIFSLCKKKSKKGTFLTDDILKRRVDIGLIFCKQFLSFTRGDLLFVWNWRQ